MRISTLRRYARATAKRVFSVRALEVFAVVFALVAGVVYFVDEHRDRVLARRMTAWTMLRDASQSSGNAGQADAIRVLLDQGANLEGVNLANASLSLIDIVGANLGSVNLQNATIEWSHLAEAFLASANLSGAKVSTVDLSDAVLVAANLHKADLFSVTLDRTDFSNADLSDAKIAAQSAMQTDFSSADLSGTEFTTLHFGDDSHAAPFEPRYIEFKREDGNIRLLGGTISPYDVDGLPCFAWVERNRPPKGLPDGYAVVLVDDPEYPGRDACSTRPVSTWPR